MAFKTKVKKRDLDAKNYIINSDMKISQRGEVFSSITSAYTLDRMYAYIDGAGTGLSIYKISNINIPEATLIDNGLKIQRDSGQSWLAKASLNYSNEIMYSRPLAGETATLSFWAKKGLDYSGLNDELNVKLTTGTVGDEGISSVFTGQVSDERAVTISNDFVRYSFTYELPSDMKQFRFKFSYIPTGTASTDDSFTITGIMFHVGEEAIPFKKFSDESENDLEICQRYYEKSYPLNIKAGTITSDGMVYYADQGAQDDKMTRRPINFTVIKRIVPLVTTYGTSSSNPNTIKGDETVISCTIRWLSETGGSVGWATAAYNVQFHWEADAEL